MVLPHRLVSTDRPRAPALAAAHDPAALVVHGFLVGSHRLDLPLLKRFERREIGPVDITCMTGQPVVRVGRYAGLRLTDMLDFMGFAQWPRSELKRCAVVAHGTDGYKAIFSWNELYNGPIGGDVLVLYERDGEPPGGHMGGLSPISAGDRMIGPRHLRRLAGIQVCVV